MEFISLFCKSACLHVSLKSPRFGVSFAKHTNMFSTTFTALKGSADILIEAKTPTYYLGVSLFVSLHANVAYIMNVDAEYT